MAYDSEFDRDTEYWNQFYRQNPPASMQESNFARFVTKYIEKGKTLVDIGCGNGRDSLFFNRLGLNVVGIDASDSAISLLNGMASGGGISFVCGNFINESSIYSGNVDYYYSRFTIHAIDEKSEAEFLQNVYSSLADNGKLFIEVRGIHDGKFGQGEAVSRNAFMLDGHYRRFVVMEELLRRLLDIGFSIRYAEESKGFAPCKGEDPEVIRIVCTKCPVSMNGLSS